MAPDASMRHYAMQTATPLLRARIVTECQTFCSNPCTSNPTIEPRGPRSSEYRPRSELLSRLRVMQHECARHDVRHEAGALTSSAVGQLALHHSNHVRQMAQYRASLRICGIARDDVLTYAPASAIASHEQLTGR
jgi:hypothetical protein